MVQSGRFAPEEARLSVETSLAELGLDSVDVLLLHECSPADAQTEGLLELLETLVQEGKVRFFGIGTDLQSTRTILEERPELGRIVQLRNSAPEPALTQLPALEGRATITHSAMRVIVARLADAMQDPGRRQRWSEELGVDCSARETLGALLMAYSLQSNTHGIVLFSSTNEERIQSNATLVEEDRFSVDQVRRFARLTREVIPAPAETAAPA
jgi:aryl-alcohol dehydrogenase-like predicted oxidoreductase